MIDELELVKQVRPEVRQPSEETRVVARRALDRAIARRARRPRMFRRGPAELGRLAPVLGMLVVAAVAVVFLSIHSRTPTGAGSRGGFQLVFRAEPTPEVPRIDSAAMGRTVQIVRQHLAALVPTARVSSAGDELVVRVGSPASTSPGEVGALAAESGRLVFYDWEANVLLRPGESVASRLERQDPTALTVSQGIGSAAPGSPGADSLSLYGAVRLAAAQPKQVSADNSRRGPEYFMFGAPGSAACAAAGQYYGTGAGARGHCYLAGPEATISELNAALPRGVNASAGETLAVKQGTVVLEAIPPNFSHEPAWSDPTAQFYVLKDHVALFGNEITHPQASTDQSGAPDVAFGFTGRGGNEFQRVTSQIAHRGDLVSGPGQTLNQHFAVALDTQLIAVPSIDFKIYPDGVSGSNGGDVTAGFTVRSARQLAAELRLGALPVNLKLIASRP
jgi:SecD/SecF fusion protein